MSSNSPECFLRLKDVAQRTGLSRSTIYRMMGEGMFPPSHSLGSKAKRWLGSEIQGWIDSRVAAAPQAEPWKPPPPPVQRVGEKKLPPLVPNKKGADA